MTSNSDGSGEAGETEGLDPKGDSAGSKASPPISPETTSHDGENR